MSILGVQGLEGCRDIPFWVQLLLMALLTLKERPNAGGTSSDLGIYLHIPHSEILLSLIY